MTYEIAECMVWACHSDWCCFLFAREENFVFFRGNNYYLGQEKRFLR